MPKKHQPSYSTTKPTAAPHTSLTSSSPPPPSRESPKSVNDKIREYRAQAATSTARSISSNEDILRALTAENRSLPAGPVRARTRNTRPAGPAAPASWNPIVSIRGGAAGLESSIHAPPHFQADRSSDDSGHGEAWIPPSILPGQLSPNPRSLRAAALRVTAECTSADAFREFADNEWFTPKIKMQILEQMALRNCLDREVVAALLDPWIDLDWNGRVVISGGNMISHIYLGPLLTDKSAWRFLTKILRRDQLSTASINVPESWDEEPQINYRQARMIVLPHLTCLSLSKAPAANWTSLIQLGSKYDALAQLTHLDLSHWPSPATWTYISLPAATPMFQRDGYFRAEIDESGITNMNSLGKSCRSLVWLGLQGCEGWIDMLAMRMERRNESNRTRFYARVAVDETVRNVIEVDWIGAYRGLQTIKFGSDFRSRRPEQARILCEHIWATRLKAGLSPSRVDFDMSS